MTINSMPTPKNQMNNCDGCARGLPVDNGRHYCGLAMLDEGICTKDRYEEPKQEEKCEHRCSDCRFNGFTYCSVCRDEVEGTCIKCDYRLSLPVASPLPDKNFESTQKEIAAKHGIMSKTQFEAYGRKHGYLPEEPTDKKCPNGCDDNHVCSKCVCPKCKAYFDSGLCDYGDVLKEPAVEKCECPDSEGHLWDCKNALQPKAEEWEKEFNKEFVADCVGQDDNLESYETVQNRKNC